MSWEPTLNGDGGSTSTITIKKLLNRFQLLEQQVAACVESLPLLYQVFNKCNVLEQRLKTWKKEVDGRLAETGPAGGSRLGIKRVQSGNFGSELNDDWEPEDEDEDVYPAASDNTQPNFTFTHEHDIEAETKPYECKICPDTPKTLFDDAEGLAKHYTSRHRTQFIDNDSESVTAAQFQRPSVPRRQQNSPTLLRARTCPKCSVTFSFSHLMKRHLDTMHTEPRFACVTCGKTFRRRDSMQSHRMRIHGVKFKIHLTRGRPTKASLDFDRRIEDKDKGNICVEEAEPLGVMQVESSILAEEDSIKAQATQAPASTAEADPNFGSEAYPLDERTCPVCKRVYGNQYHMRRHQHTMHKAPSFPCDLDNCQKLFRRQDELKAHQLRIHGRISEALPATRQWKRRNQGNKPKAGAVAVTEKLQTKSNSLHGNRGVSDDGYQYSRATCAECGMSVLKVNFKRHMGIHTGRQRPLLHMCEVCGKGFRDNHNLRIHQRSHTGERPFACTTPGCETKFSSEHAMKTHMRRSHGQGRGRDPKEDGSAAAGVDLFDPDADPLLPRSQNNQLHKNKN